VVTRGCGGGGGRGDWKLLEEIGMAGRG